MVASKAIALGYISRLLLFQISPRKQYASPSVFLYRILHIQSWSTNVPDFMLVPGIALSAQWGICELVLTETSERFLMSITSFFSLKN